VKSLHNTPRTAGFILRRDLLWLLLWVVGIVVLTASFVPFIPEILGGPAEKETLAATMKSPAMVAICGMFYGESYTNGVMYTQMMLVWVILVAAVMNIMFVIKHTRRDEEDGRLELLGSLPVGRLAGLFSTVFIIFLVNVVLALLIGASMAAFQVAEIDWTGSLFFGLAVGVAGMVFAGVAAVCAQVCSSARGATGVSFAFLGLAYLLRAAGDVAKGTENEILAFISPLGLAERVECYATNAVWPLPVLLGMALCLFILAFILNGQRDMGQGFFSPRSGRAHASALLRGPWSLARRLTHPTFFAWAVAMFAFGAAYGSVFADFTSFYETNDILRDLVGATATSGDLLDPIIALLTVLMSMLTVVPALLILFRVKTEEVNQRTEQVYSRAVSRPYNLLGYVLLAVLASCVFQFLYAFGVWVAAAFVMPNPVSFATLIIAATSFLPAIWVFVGLGALLVGMSPRLAPLCWVLLGASFVLVYVGRVLTLPDWVMTLSPFGALPLYPTEDLSALAMVVLTLIALVLCLFGLLFYRNRNLKG